jgi:uncharacterized delta-60 repeat protein
MKSRIFPLLALITLTCNAQMPIAGNIDPNFGISGSVSPLAQKDLVPFSINVQEKTAEIITAGYYKTPTGKYIGFIGRYDFYGHPKSNFGTNGVLEISDLSTENQIIHKAFFESSDPNSPIIIKGTYKSGTITIPYVSRYLSDGTLDTSYGTKGSITGIKGEIHGNYIYSLVLNTTTQHQTFNRYHLADGSLDTTFNNGDLPFLISETKFNTTQYDNINVQADGKIILCGYTIINGFSFSYIARYDSTGHIDTAFGDNGYYKGNQSENIQYTKTQSDGKIVFFNENYENYKTLLGRLNIDGTLDTTYGSLGYFKYNFPFSGGNYIDNLIMQSDDKILFCGSEIMVDTGNESSLFLTRVSKTGTIDFWRRDLQTPYSENWSMALIKDSYILTFGNTTNTTYNPIFPLMQRIYLKSPIISLNGNGLQNGNADIDLISTDGIVYSVENISLTANNIKFRLDHADNFFWGTATTSPFPSGVSTMGQEDIMVNKTGIYNVTFNIKTGEYSFTNTLGIHDFIGNKEKFTFYPNPSKEKLMFNENLKSIKIYTADGKLINLNLANNEINTNALPKGIYYFQAVTENDDIIGNKFIKE